MLFHPIRFSLKLESSELKPQCFLILQQHNHNFDTTMKKNYHLVVLIMQQLYCNVARNTFPQFCIFISAIHTAESLPPTFIRGLKNYSTECILLARKNTCICIASYVLILRYVSILLYGECAIIDVWCRRRRRRR